MSLHYVGEVLSGGMVFHTVHISDIEEECFIMSLNDVAPPDYWSDVNESLTASTSIWDGKYNTQLILSQSGHTKSAAHICRDFDNGNWYLPSISELKMIHQVFWELNYHLSIHESAEELKHEIYWTSCEYNWKKAHTFNFEEGEVHFLKKTTTKARIRAIKKVPC